MKTSYNNTRLMLLLFTTLLFNTQNFAQNTNEESLDKTIVRTTTGINDPTIENCNFNVVLDEVEILLKERQKNNMNFQKINEAIVSKTTSKLGNNFCKLFCKFNQSNEVSYPFAVSIIEKFVKGNKCPEICIFANNNIVYKFRSLAKDTYLYAAVQESNKRLKAFQLSNKQLYAGE